MTQELERDSMAYDVVIVGAGVAGLSVAIRLKQLAAKQEREISVCVLEKGSEVGAHILSGAVIDPRALSELFPNWQELGAPLQRSVERDEIWFLTQDKSWQMPIVPPSFQNHGNYIISLGLLCKWLAEQAEQLGVEIYAGFAAAEVLYHENGAVKGVATGNMGVGKDGEPTDSFQLGMELHAQQTIFAEGARGSLSKQIIKQFQLDKHCQAQTYGLGIKEIWEVPAEQCRAGTVIHTMGYPLDSQTYGGSFIYHLDNNQIALGLVVGLDYQNPYLSPFEELQRLKLHPKVRAMLEGGRRIAYGARALVEGGLQSLPKLSFAGGVLVGDAAGFLNVPRIKGSHTAMKSAMLAAEAIFPLLENSEQEQPAHGKTAARYQGLFENSWLYQELHAARNIRPAFKWGLLPAMAYTALEQYVFKGRTPWTLKHHGSDASSLQLAANCTPIDYPKPDGKLTFDRLSSVFLANVSHEENQPAHLQLLRPDDAIAVNWQQYASPETRYCPAGVYEIVQEQGAEPRLQINAANCIHCKTCDIKDPTQNIQWNCPEGGSGPNYGAM
ncbi:electron transfer flavoprotein-ubiquinone oxidoreductase [Kingella kingae]|uniref:electron transfer flavoprotein-ubiquinone oxidoreductase n=2 Tax=Kingella kingae TaxID=504 RepID=UPI000400EA57|nr:electron transfer flavoprotein-ubiquinone oxidoreductase [Kingella kingae]MBD3613039.1 electron transfer flavoprotein-ubiquinone oxidoreductase [Kingella kingae]MBD3631397.1 electron transfer flavoprotein-ubiquinone oxidoreductase [Kingella kingae]MBD3658705.1 electron transfer flavoprotein-ubiquinone oxidoreductase [Kingella kingae]MDK4586705.1 electron transfer flavoprotein-ubiquinone oxidoreductase [Kingella kingae]MDK4604776.1 electron transfer flavoprotein-ubiquinone oxidoreductase [Ki